MQELFCDPQREQLPSLSPRIPAKPVLSDQGARALGAGLLGVSVPPMAPLFGGSDHKVTVRATASLSTRLCMQGRLSGMEEAIYHLSIDVIYV